MRDGVHHLLDPLLDQQRQSWLSGSRPLVEELLSGSSLRDDADVQLDLIYNEIVLRDELGEKATAEEYVRRYPHLRDAIELQFEVHNAIHDPGLIQTARLGEIETRPDDRASSKAGWPEPPEYEILHLLGEGGMGVVYQARHRRLRRHVALKMFRAGRRPSPREVMRIQTEAEAIARLRHPNIVQIFEIGTWNDLPFLSLELAEGGTLAHRLERHALPPREAAELIETLGRAVHHAHEQGIVHRDLKPANVLFAADGTPKVTDFGLAKVLEDDADVPRDATRTGDAIGTPRYMSPEQAAGLAEIGPAADVYALGTLLYESLTGRAPFVAASVADTYQLIRTEEPLSPRRLQPTVPRDLETICLKCLLKNPARRYASASALADDLRRFRNREPIMARPTPTWERVWKWCRRRPTHAALLAVAVVLLVSGTVAGVVWDRMEKRRVAQVRDEVEALMEDGQAALAREDEDTAEARFREAWLKVQGEPRLRDYQTGIAGWLDHSRRAAGKQRWKQRVPPREYDEKRDEALFRSLLQELPGEKPIGLAREAVAAALELTLPSDPAWRQERERLALVDADLLLLEAGPAQALVRLEAVAGSSRLFHSRRARLLDQLGRGDEAGAARRQATQLPPDDVAARFFDGMDSLRRKDFTAAVREFEAVLDAEPEHFPARLFLAISLLRQDRAAEAKVALTACIAQRPRFAWSYHFRGQCAHKLGDMVAAERDAARAAELQPDLPNQ